MPRIYEDPNLDVLIDEGRLTENVQYYIDWGALSEPQILEILQLSGLSAFTDWVPGNRVATLKITNYIGSILLGGRLFDVRSPKFLSGLSGQEQVDRLVKEIEEIASGISFSPSSPSLLSRDFDWDKPSASILHEFNYYYQTVFALKHEVRLSTLLEQIKAHPSVIYKEHVVDDYIWNVRASNRKILRSFVASSGPTIELERCKGIFEAHPVKKALEKHGVSKVPLKVVNPRQLLSYDTIENQLVRYILERIEVVSRLVSQRFGSDYPDIEFRARKLNFEMHKHLSDPFFLDVSNLKAMPTQSAVLLYRHGYKEIYEHFQKSRLRVLPIFEALLDDMNIALRDIATIYEIWCFYKVASMILGDEIVMESCGDRLADGELFYETVLSNEHYEVAYNKSFLRSAEMSYSLTLRPDISVTSKETGVISAFDAKYRVNNILDRNSEIVTRKYNSSDIHKMHTYVDAISSCRSSIALYVGDIFAFFQKQDFGKIYADTSDEFDLDGVGVLPLVPGEEGIASTFFLQHFGEGVQVV